MEGSTSIFKFLLGREVLRRQDMEALGRPIQYAMQEVLCAIHELVSSTPSQLSPELLQGLAHVPLARKPFRVHLVQDLGADGVV